VDAYLLKPIEEEELIELINRFHKEASENERINRILNSSQKLDRISAVNAIIKGEDYDSITLRYGVETTDSYRDFESFTAAIIKIRNIAAEEAITILENVFIQEESIELYNIKGNILVLFKGCNQKTIDRVIKTIRSRIKKENDSQVFSAIGRKVKKITDLYSSFKDAEAYIKNQFYYEHLGVVYYGKEEDLSFQDSTLSEFKNEDIFNIVEKIYVLIEFNNLEDIRSHLKNMEELFKINNLQPEKVKGIFVNIIIMLISKIESNYLKVKGMFNSDKIVDEIFRAHNIVQIRDYIMSVAEDIGKAVGTENSEVMMKRIIDYVNKNYEKDLKLESLAELFNYNKKYLGQLFKNCTGEYFNTYIDDLRIENAKRFLSMGLKAPEIWQKVGFKNLDYFYSKFKKREGIGPSGYQKMKEREENI
jgi:two-component system response regulator YesN